MGCVLVSNEFATFNSLGVSTSSMVRRLLTTYHMRILSSERYACDLTYSILGYAYPRTLVCSLRRSILVVRRKSTRLQLWCVWLQLLAVAGSS